MKTFLSLTAAGIMALGFGFVPTAAQAGECTTGLCGTPDQSGGGCGCGCGSILIAMTDRGDSYQFADDFDGDGIEDDFDNCPFGANYDQSDVDGDGVGDTCDSCATTANPFQDNLDGDAFGDACDDDIDNDGFLNDLDNCQLSPNQAQIDTDLDGQGDACDDDDDGDLVPDFEDDCRLIANTQGDVPSTGCEDDSDGDDIDSGVDNCPNVQNADQLDTDLDGYGDLCDLDIDNDGIDNSIDNCPSIANPSQVDVDRDGVGDAGRWDGGAESCDDTECHFAYVGDSADCLNPLSAFQVRLDARPISGDPLTEVFRTGEEITIFLFSNRTQVNHSWTARLNRLPSDSRAALDNAQGSGATIGDTVQVAAQHGDGEWNFIRFTPDEPGDYEIQVTVALPEGDPSNLGSDTAVATITTTVEGESKGGCAAGVPSALVAVLLAGLAFIRRRRD